MVNRQPISPDAPGGTRQSIVRTVRGGNEMSTDTGAANAVPAGMVAVNRRTSSDTAAHSPGTVMLYSHSGTKMTLPVSECPPVARNSPISHSAPYAARLCENEELAEYPCVVTS